ncbi:hypothetical protein GGI43DRAFT_77053 [Trichoderma evansii]
MKPVLSATSEIAPGLLGSKGRYQQTKRGEVEIAREKRTMDDRERGRHEGWLSPLIWRITYLGMLLILPPRHIDGFGFSCHDQTPWMPTPDFSWPLAVLWLYYASLRQRNISLFFFSIITFILVPHPICLHLHPLPPDWLIKFHDL